MNQGSSASHICDELSIEKSILLSFVLSNETNAGNDDQDENDGEEELDEICVISCSCLVGLLKLYKIYATLLGA